MGSEQMLQAVPASDSFHIISSILKHAFYKFVGQMVRWLQSYEEIDGNGVRRRGLGNLHGLG